MERPNPSPSRAGRAETHPEPGCLYPPPPVAANRRVAVTGCGLVTALGQGWETNARGFQVGRCGIQPVSLFDVASQRVKVAGEAVTPESIPGTRLSAKRLRRTDRATRLLLAAAHEAWTQSGCHAPARLPVVLGTTSAGMPLGEAFYREAVSHPARRRGQPTRIVHYQAQCQVTDLLDSLGCHGPINIIANACASGTNAVGHAWEMIRSGRATRALTGGYDGLSQLVFAGFDSLQALSPTGCRPFAADRDGLALGEGAAVLLLESLEEANARGATILGEILGYGASTDTHHLTQPRPDGRAALASMTTATRLAGIRPADIDYINAHGTGTRLNDAAETAAINAWAGDATPALRVSSTKGSVGHLLGAAGALEAVVCLMALREQWLPPSPATKTVDPACRFQYVTTPTRAPLTLALSNSFGFGGANATLILKRWT